MKQRIHGMDDGTKRWERAVSVRNAAQDVKGRRHGADGKETQVKEQRTAEVVI